MRLKPSYWPISMSSGIPQINPMALVHDEIFETYSEILFRLAKAWKEEKIRSEALLLLSVGCDRHSEIKTRPSRYKRLEGKSFKIVVEEYESEEDAFGWEVPVRVRLKKASCGSLMVSLKVELR